MSNEEKQYLHDLIDDLEQSLYIKDYEQTKIFKQEIQSILEKYN